MSQTGLKAFDSTLQTTNIWLNEIMDQLSWEDRHRSYHALRAVLHALRDQLSVEECAAFGAQLPLLIRGVYYEGWKPSKVPARERRKSQFLAHIGMAYRDEPDIDLEQITQVVFQVISNHVSTGEIEGIKNLLSGELRTLWPVAV
jgi:uncharacterized protein (DUF2267 family)